MYEVFLVFLGVDEDLISEVTTNKVDDVPEPCTRVPARHTSSIANVRVVEGNEGVKDKSSPGPAAQEPCQRHEEMTGEGDENRGSWLVAHHVLLNVFVFFPEIAVLAEEPTSFCMAFDDVVPLCAEGSADAPVTGG